MPIFEYECQACNNKFEELVSSATTAIACPRCNSTDTRKQLSMFAASTGSSAGSMPSCASSGCGGSGFS
jgi:putative FmdB family regulatory protein